MGSIRAKYTTDEILAALEKHGFNKTHAAAELGVSREILRYWIKTELLDRGAPDDEYTPKIWIYDIETSPMLSYIWRMWQKASNLDAIMTETCMLTWAGRWYGETETLSDSAFADTDFSGIDTDINDSRIAKTLWDKFDEADVVVAHNGNKFDQKHANARAIVNGMTPPRPYKQIDTLNICKANFNFTSNKLEYVAQTLCGYGKIPTGGFDLWKRCMLGDKDAWDHMLKYNVGDVDVLEDVWIALAPWDKRTPSYVTHSDRDVATCTNIACGSTNVVENGSTVSTGLSRFIGYTCKDCGHHMRGRQNIRSKEQMANTLMNA